MFKSTVLLSIADVMTVTGYKRARAGSIVPKVNACTEKQGFITPRRGCCYIKAFCPGTAGDGYGLHGDPDRMHR